MASDSLETAIHQELSRVYLCTMEELSGLLVPRFSRAQVAATVDRLIENGSISRRSSDPSRVLLWLPPLRSGRGPRHESPPGNPMDIEIATTEYEIVTNETKASYTPL